MHRPLEFSRTAGTHNYNTTFHEIKLKGQEKKQNTCFPKKCFSVVTFIFTWMDLTALVQEITYLIYLLSWRRVRPSSHIKEREKAMKQQDGLYHKHTHSSFFLSSGGFQI